MRPDDPLVPDRLGNARHMRASSRRDHLANERTFLAWLRTSVTLAGFGFVVERLDVVLRLAGLVRPGLAAAGTLLTLSGCLFALLGIWRFILERRRIQTGEAVAGTLAPLAIAVGVLLVDASLVALLVLRR